MIIPCFKVKQHIASVISKIGPEVDLIVVVDDACPENTSEYIESIFFRDKRIKIIKHTMNLGVGEAVMSGYKQALMNSMDIVVKIDGDGQMDPTLILDFVFPILNGDADYTKGNRFYNLEEILTMPKKRIFGNVMLSFINKISSGYWNIFDPTNGYTAIHADIIRMLPLNKISKRYFFESDMLFRLNTIKAVVKDIPMHANYGKEKSNFKVRNILFEFFLKHIKNTFKRIFYNYYLRDISIASFELPLGLILLCFGIMYGLDNWLYHMNNNTVAPNGTIVLSALTTLIGLQFILEFLSYDINSIPLKVLHRKY